MFVRPVVFMISVDKDVYITGLAILERETDRESERKRRSQ